MLTKYSSLKEYTNIADRTKMSIPYALRKVNNSKLFNSAAGPGQDFPAHHAIPSQSGPNSPGPVRPAILGGSGPAGRQGCHPAT